MNEEAARGEAIYAKRTDFTYEVHDGIVTIHRQQTHPIQDFFRKYLKWHIPRQSSLTLDAIGSMVFQLIDGKRTVSEIATLLKNTYPSTDIHLMTRLVLYLDKLEKDEHLIVYLHDAQ